MAPAPGHGETDRAAAQARAGPTGGADQRRGGGAAGRRARRLGLTSRLSAVKPSHADHHADVSCGSPPAMPHDQRTGERRVPERDTETPDVPRGASFPMTPDAPSPPPHLF